MVNKNNEEPNHRLQANRQQKKLESYIDFLIYQ